MNSIVRIFWNAVMTATVVTLLSGLFVAAMPPVYRATATVKGSPDDKLVILSADLIRHVAGGTQANLNNLSGWFEQLAQAKPSGENLLQQKLFVQVGEEHGWIDITVEAQDAETATTLANDVATAFVRRSAVVRLSVEDKAALFVQVEQTDQSLLAFLAEHPKLLYSSNEHRRLNTELAALATKKNLIKSDRNKLQATLGFLDSGQLGAISEPGIVRASKEVELQQQRHAELSTRYGSQHQKMKSKVAELEVAKTYRQAQVAAYRTRLVDQSREVENRLAEVERSIDTVNVSSAALASSLLVLEELKQDQASALHKFQGMSEDTVFETFAQALPPQNSLGFNQLLLLGFVFLASFTLMVALMVFRVASLNSRKTS
jgi:uncharacterized protein involved in exopolysaccharide biosynthesis